MSVRREPKGNVMNERKLIAVVVIVAIGLCGTLSLGIIFRSKAKAAARAKEIAVLADALGRNIARSNELVAKREFEPASAALRELEPKIATMLDANLEEQFQRAIWNVADAKRDYQRKLNQGYSIFEGQFISRDQKDRILAERQRKRDEDERQEQEDRRIAQAEREDRIRREQEVADRMRREADRIAAEEAKHYVQSMPAIFKAEGGEVYLSFHAFTLHVPKGGARHSLPYMGFFNIHYKKRGDVQGPTAGFFEIDGNPVKITYTSSDDAVASVAANDHGHADLIVKNGGTAMIRVTVGNAYVVVPLKVVELPVTVGMQASDVIQIMGMPSEKSQEYCSWPDAKTIDGIFYNPDARQGIISAQHWRFRGYPNAVLSIQNKALGEVRTYDSGEHDKSYENYSEWVDRG